MEWRARGDWRVRGVILPRCSMTMCDASIAHFHSLVQAPMFKSDYSLRTSEAPGRLATCIVLKVPCEVSLLHAASTEMIVVIR